MMALPQNAVQVRTLAVRRPSLPPGVAVARPEPKLFLKNHALAARFHGGYFVPRIASDVCLVDQRNSFRIAVAERTDVGGIRSGRKRIFFGDPCAKPPDKILTPIHWPLAPFAFQLGRNCHLAQAVDDCGDLARSVDFAG